jgi:hypothetical protein
MFSSLFILFCFFDLFMPLRLLTFHSS